MPVRRALSGLTALAAVAAVVVLPLTVAAHSPPAQAAGSARVATPPAPPATMQLRRVVSEEAGACPTGYDADPPAGAAVRLPDPQGRVCYTLGPAQLSIGRSRARVTADQSGRSAVVFAVPAGVAAAFDRLARADYHQQVAVVMFGRVMAAPEVNSTSFHGSGVISGLDPATAAKVAAALDGGR